MGKNVMQNEQAQNNELTDKYINSDSVNPN